MASSSSSSAASAAVRSWWTSFLTLRDEALASPPPAAVLGIIRSVVLSHPPGVLASAATERPPHEVLSDVVFLAELGSAICGCEGVENTLFQVCNLVLRKVMDFLASKNLLIEGYEMSRFYVTLLDCLHLVLSTPKICISEHVAGFLVALQTFLTYGLNSRSPPLPGNAGYNECNSSRLKSGSVESKNIQHSR